MKTLLMLLALFAASFAQEFKQDDRGFLIIGERFEAGELSANLPPDNQLDIRWLGFYVGAQALNRFQTGSLIKTEVKPYAVAILGLGEKFTMHLQAIVPTKKRDVIFWRIGLDRRIDKTLFGM
jgi:hypothetical protein